MAVTKDDVIEVFEASQACEEIDQATEVLGDGLAKLFNGGGSTPGDTYITQNDADARYRRLGVTVPAADVESITFTQSSPSSVWGPVSHSFGRYAVVSVKDSSGHTVYGDIRETSIGSVTVSFAKPCSGTMLLT